MARPGADLPARIDRWRELAILTLVLAGAFAIPIVFQRDPYNMFRLPKAILLRAEAILIVSVTLGAVFLGAEMPRPRWRDPWLLLPLGAFVAFAVTTLTSTNRVVSMGAFGSAAATIVIFYATVAAARRSGWSLIAVPLAAAMANAILVVVEETNLWMPFGAHGGILHHLECDALIGNPNEVGSYLGAALLACLAAIASRDAGNRWSAGSILIAAVLGAGFIASQTLTAIIAFAAAGIIAVSSFRNVVRVVVVGAATGVLIVVLMAPLRLRATNMIGWLRAGDYNAFTTDRLTPFVTAWSMFRENPLTGVGPGAFAWQYYDYKIRAEEQHPFLRQAYNRGLNFGEVHNDHLQALAEGGIVGYAAFVVLVGGLAWLSFSIPSGAPDWRQRFARQLALPLAIFWVVLSLAQFPLESTVVRSLVFHLAALCVGWRNT
jgi:O-antigen ligase